MQEITYKQAAEFLGCEYITIRQAVSSKRLTRCVNKKTLLKEQVNLFKDKRGITPYVLNIEEKELWETYKEIAENPELMNKVNFISMTSDEVIEKIIKNKLNNSGKETSKEEYYLIIKSSREAIESLLRSINGHPPMPLAHQN